MAELRTADGLPLALREWPASTSTPGAAAARGRVLIVHGLGEHSARYAGLAAELNAAGFTVTAYDHRGHGASGGARGRIAGSFSLCEDLGLVIDHCRSLRDGALPLVLLGHSMGGLVAARFVAEALRDAPAEWSRPVDRLVLSSPALDPGMNAVQKLLLAILGTLAPDLAVGNGLKPEWISRDPAVVRAYLQDPLVHDRVSARLVRFIVEGGAFLRAQAPHWRVPTLLLWAGADRCVAPAGSAAFAAAAPPAVVQHQVYAGFAHEIFNEPEADRRQVIARLLRFL